MTKFDSESHAAAANDARRPTSRVDNCQLPPTSLSSEPPPTTTMTNRLLTTGVQSSLRPTNWDSIEEIDASDATRIPTALGHFQKSSTSLEEPPPSETNKELMTAPLSIPPCHCLLQRSPDRSASNQSLCRCVFQRETQLSPRNGDRHLIFTTDARNVSVSRYA